MTTMLERAARALFDAYTDLAYGDDGCSAEEVEDIWLEGREGFIKSARALLLAVREPDDAGFMAEAMNLEGPLSRGVISAPEFFTAMIDAVLEGK